MLFIYFQFQFQSKVLLNDLNSVYIQMNGGFSFSFKICGN